MQNPMLWNTIIDFPQESLHCHLTDHNPPLSSSGVLDSPPPPYPPTSPHHPLQCFVPQTKWAKPGSSGNVRKQWKLWLKSPQTRLEAVSFTTQFSSHPQPNPPLQQFQISNVSISVAFHSLNLSYKWLQLVQSGDGAVRNWAAPVILWQLIFINLIPD